MLYSSLRISTIRTIAMTISSVTMSRITALAAAAGYCRSAIWFIIRPTEALCPPLIKHTVTKVAHDQGHHEDRADGHAWFGQRENHIPQDLPTASSAIGGGGEECTIDPHHGVEDRDDHKEAVEMHER